MRADRLLSIISLLQLNKQMTAQELSNKLEVSIRSIYRDIDVLTTMGVPVIADRGHNGGIKLLGDYKTDLSGLNDEELKYLFLAPAPQILDDLDIENANHKSLLKVLGRTSKHQLQLVENVQKYVYLDISSWHKKESDNKIIIQDLQKAIWNTTEISIKYSKPNEVKEVRLQPLGLVNKKGIWYLIAIDDIIKTYKISSIVDLSITNIEFHRPCDFNLEEYWKTSTSNFIEKIPKYRFTIETTKEILYHIENRKFISILDIKDNNNSIHLVLEFNAKWQAVEFVLGYGDKVQVVEPEEVKLEVIKTAESILAMYSHLS